MNKSDLMENIEILKGNDLSLNRIKCNVFYFEKDQKKYLIKLFDNGSLSMKASNFLTGKRSRFKNEISVNKVLETIDFSYFRHPKLVETDNRTYIVYEYIDGMTGWDKLSSSEELLVKAVLEFNLVDKIIEQNFYQRNLFYQQRKIPNKMVKWSFKLLKSPGDVGVWFKLNRVIISEALLYKGIDKYFFTHKDLFRFNNIITTAEKELFFVDFEFTGRDNKWFLIDIFDIAFDLEKLHLNKALFDKYIHHLSEKMTEEACVRVMHKQTRIIMLRKLLGLLSSNIATQENKTRGRQFIIGTLLDDQNYKAWFKSNIEPVTMQFKGDDV